MYIIILIHTSLMVFQHVFGTLFLGPCQEKEPTDCFLIVLLNVHPEDKSSIPQRSGSCKQLVYMVLSR